jgi:hypothetical protein
MGNVGDPDPHVFGPSGSGSISKRYGSGSFPFLIKVLSGTGSAPKCHGSPTLLKGKGHGENGVLIFINKQKEQRAIVLWIRIFWDGSDMDPVYRHELVPFRRIQIADIFDK